MFRAICSMRAIGTAVAKDPFGRSAESATKLFVSNIPWTVSNKELGYYFAQFGEVEKANVVFNPDTGLSRNYAFVSFSHINAVAKAMEQKHHMLEGNLLNVAVERPKVYKPNRGDVVSS